MGCGCKKTTIGGTEEITKNEGITLGKIGRASLMVIVLLILTPFLLIGIWWFGLLWIFNKDFNLLSAMSEQYMKYQNKEEINTNQDEEFNIDDYELVDVEVIK